MIWSNKQIFLFFSFLAFYYRHDTTPSILHFEIEEGIPDGNVRPTKRVKHTYADDFLPRPTTIAQRLSQGTYTDLAPLLDEISSVASAVISSFRSEVEKREEPPSNAPTPKDCSVDELPLLLAKVLLFQQTAHNLAIVERSRRPRVFHQDIAPASQMGLTSKVCLTVMSQNGPLFSSLQKPTTVATSTTPSTASTPAPSPSTAPTSLQSSPLKPKSVLSELSVVQPIPESSLPVIISATRAHSSKLTFNNPPLPVKTIGESFPPPPHLRPLAPPPPRAGIPYGLTWGGMRVGSPPPEIIHESQTKTGSWLSYKNDGLDALGRTGSINSPTTLPAEFVAAYTSFAPSWDDSAVAVPSAVKQMVWWTRMGKASFHKLIGKSDSLIVVEDASEADADAMDVDPIEEEFEVENEEEEFRTAVENYQPAEIPIDFRLLNDDWKNEPDTTSDATSFNSDMERKLARISSLLESLYRQQHIRLAAAPPPPPLPTQTPNSPYMSSSVATPVVGTPSQPNELEIMLYNDTVKELTDLISQLPPHMVATIHGDKDGELAISSILPLMNGKEVWKGTLPSIGVNHQPRPVINGYPSQSPQLSHPAQAMTSATGVAPNVAPQAPMNSVPMQQQASQQYHLPAQHQTPVRVPVNVPAPPPPTPQYHTARMPQQGAPQGYSQPVLTPQPQQTSYHSYQRRSVPNSNPAPMLQQPLLQHYPNSYVPRSVSAVPVTPQPVTRVISPVTSGPLAHQPYQSPTPQSQTSQLFHTHSYPPQHQQQVPQTPQRTPQPSQNTHYIQNIQPPLPRVIGSVNALSQQQQQYQMQPQATVYHQHHIPAAAVQVPAQQPVYHQHTIPQSQGPQQSQYHHHHHVIRNAYPQQGQSQAQNMSPLMGYQQIQPQAQGIPYQGGQVSHVQRGMNVPPPQSLTAVGYGVSVPGSVPVPQMQGIPTTPTPVRYRK